MPLQKHQVVPITRLGISAVEPPHAELKKRQDVDDRKCTGHMNGLAGERHAKYMFTQSIRIETRSPRGCRGRRRHERSDTPGIDHRGWSRFSGVVAGWAARARTGLKSLAFHDDGTVPNLREDSPDVLTQKTDQENLHGSEKEDADHRWRVSGRDV